jgi:hypothetical protein
MRVILKLESLDGRILPGGGWGSVGGGSDFTLTGVSKPTGAIGTLSLDDPDPGTVQGGSKPGVGGGSSNSVGDPDTSIELLGSKPSVAPGTNATGGFELFHQAGGTGVEL